MGRQEVVGLYFVQCLGRHLGGRTSFASLESPRVGFYRITYEDGSTHVLDLRYKVNIVEWYDREIIVIPAQGVPVWFGETAGGDSYTLYAYPWRNPFPQLAIDHLDLFVLADQPPIALLALTVEPVTQDGDTQGKGGLSWS